MAFSRRLFFAANWKMNKLLAEMPEFIEKFKSGLGQADTKKYEVLLAPMATHLSELRRLVGSAGILTGAQNCGVAKFGAYTGEISPTVLKELGCSHVIVGHSERRHVFNEPDQLIAMRMNAAIAEDLGVVVCVGEVLQDRKAGRTFKIIENQLSILKPPQFDPTKFQQVVLAYEPVWAIGTGENATPVQAQEVHAFIRAWLAEKVSASVAETTRILYGGSVKAENSAQLMAQPDIDGLLVGGASLDGTSFAGVVKNGLSAK